MSVIIIIMIIMTTTKITTIIIIVILIMIIMIIIKEWFTHHLHTARKQNGLCVRAHTHAAFHNIGSITCNYPTQAALYIYHPGPSLLGCGKYVP